MPEMGDEADAPIIVPPPGQILRRAARTKIRKPSLPGDGGGHRFGASRRGAGARPVGAAPASTPGVMEPRTSSDVSSSDHGESTESPTDPGMLRQRTFSNESMENPRPDSFSEEASIYDAYARDEDEDIPPPVLITSPPPTTVDLPVSPPPPEAPPLVVEEPESVLHHPQPQRLVVPQTPEPQGVPRTTPSPEPSPPSGESPSTTTSPTSSRVVTSPSPSPSASSRNHKDKKGLFGKWGGDKGGKKSGKEKERERERERVEKEKEKESGFFGSLFGSKKKPDEHPPPLITGGSAGREAAQALLGASKSSKSYNPPPSPLSSGLGNSYARYPIHVERAIYRLSHIKLANPRRPLYEQVLISNLMFWYLGVINKAQNPPEPPVEGQAPSSTGTEAAGGGQTNHSGSEDQEQRERELREKAEKERLEREQQEREREMEMQKKKESRRGPLTKPASTGTSGSSRRAEMPVKGPQYEMQHRVMEQEYDGYNNNGQRSQGPPRTSSAQSPGGQSRQQSSSQAPKLVVQPQPQLQLSDSFYYNGGEFMQNNQPQLPPGAMPPIPTDQSTWLSQSSTSPRKHSSPSPPPMSPGTGAPHRRSRSPPPVHKHGQQSVNRYSPNSVPENHNHGGNRQPSRSLSATAVPSHPPPPVNGKVRKGVSAHAVVAQSQGSRRPRTSEGTGEEEDLPLAIWQQQRRK